MQLWYDVSDLMAWSLPHLTGIQRAVVGIHNGLVDVGARPRVVHWDGMASRFVPTGPESLPQTIRQRFTGVETWVGSAAPAPADVPEPRPAAPRRRRSRILGSSPEAEELAASYRRFRGAVRRYVRTLVRRPRPAGPPSPPPADAETRVTLPAAPVVAVGHPFAPGDVFLSVGANWTAGHAQATASLRPEGVRVMRMIYDLIPTLKPQWMNGSQTRDITLWAREVLTASDHVLTISEFSRREIEGYCEEGGLPVPDISVVRLGDVHDAAGAAAGGLALPRFMPSRPFFLCVSTLDTRKNHRLLFDAWTMLAAADPQGCPDLLCVGVPHLLVADLLRELRGDRTVNGRIHVLRNVADAELAWYYRNCAATIYPSRYEGWGLPVAESLAHGKLCLASAATSIPEISPDLPEFFAPHDVEGLIGLVRRVLEDPAWVREREQAIRERFRPTRWSQTATHVLAAARQAGRGVRAAA